MEKTSPSVKRQWPKWLFSGLTVALLVVSWSLYARKSIEIAELTRGWPRTDDVHDSLKKEHFIGVQILPTLQIIFVLDVIAVVTFFLRWLQGLENDKIIIGKVLLGIILGLTTCYHGLHLLVTS